MIEHLSRSSAQSSVAPASPPRARRGPRWLALFVCLFLILLVLTPVSQSQVGYGIEAQAARDAVARRDSIKAARELAEERAAEEARRQAAAERQRAAEAAIDSIMVGPPLPAVTAGEEGPVDAEELTGTGDARGDGTTRPDGAAPAAGLAGEPEPVTKPGADTEPERVTEPGTDTKPPPPPRERFSDSAESAFERLLSPAMLAPPTEERLTGPPRRPAQPESIDEVEVGLWSFTPPKRLAERRAAMLGPAIRPFAERFRFDVVGDRRTSDVDVDLDRGLVSGSQQVNDIEVSRTPPQDMRGYAYEVMVMGRWESWTTRARTLVGKQLRETDILSAGRGKEFVLDKDLGPVSKVLGRGASIRVQGTERISMSGTSRWDAAHTDTDTRRQSKFPQLDLRQDLNIKVDGKVGDKVSIDWKENSNADTPLSNRISIRYKGYDDEVIQTLDLGNTNLSLPGTGFVSYNGQHQGLFGVKASSQFGDFDLTVIASKQEGQTASSGYSGHAKETQGDLLDIDYVPRRFFFLVDPVDPLMTGELIPPDDSRWRPPPTITDLQIWIDDGNQNNNGSTVPGILFPDPNNIAGLNDTIPARPITGGHYDVLTLLEDYELRYDLFTLNLVQAGGEVLPFQYPVLDMRRSLNSRERLGATFTATFLDRNGQPNTVITFGSIADTVRMKGIAVVKGDFELVTPDGLFYSPLDYWYPIRILELRNIYDLRARDIDKSTLRLTVRSSIDGESREHMLNKPNVTYLRLLGVDKEDEYGNATFDQIIDDSFIKLDQGLIILPDLRPFAPGDVDQVWPFFRADLGANLAEPADDLRPDFFITDDDEASNAPNRNVYDKRDINRGIDTRYFFDYTYATQQTQFRLNAPGTILDGSETVVVDGVTLTRGRDYRIDYETGLVRLTGQYDIQPDSEVNIDYAYAPLFALGQKTLMGFNVGWLPSPDRHVGATLLYESSGVSERRPKLGEEPRRTIVADLNGRLKTTPFWMTQMVDRLPFMRVNGDSRFNLSGEVAVSLPNPNTRGEVYLDDFEGAKETFALSINREQWSWSSRPQAIEVISTDETYMRGGLLWYNPVRSPVRERDLFPELDPLEGDDRRQVLLLHLEPQVLPDAPQPSDNWVGLTQGVSSTGADFTRKQFIEIWLNDFRQLRASDARLYVDLGTINEDAVWQEGVPPDRQPNSEDINEDGILDLNENDVYEDTGLDRLRSVDEEGYDATSAPDPSGDDFSFDRDAADDPYAYDAYRGINRLEENRHLDEEDINRDGVDQTFSSNNYFEYEIELSDTTYVAIDVQQDFGVGVDDDGRPNGWRLFRIPIDDGVPVGQPTRASVRHLRVWFTGISDTLDIQLGSIDILGNLYEIEALHDTTDAVVESPGTDEMFKIRGINNKEDANEYIPPFALEERDRITEREGSLALDFENLEPGHQGTAFRAFPNARDFTLYETLKWYVFAGEDPHAAPDSLGCSAVDGVEAFVRFGADTLNYYEYAVPLVNICYPQWFEIDVPITDLSNLKVAASSADSVNAVRIEGRLLKLVGQPSFTRVRRLTFGIRNVSSTPRSGTVWYDELRLDDVIRDTGTAMRLNMDVALADFMTLGVDLTTQDEDFLSIGSSGRKSVSRGTGTSRRDFRFRSSTNLHKFFETSGIRLPVGFNYSDQLELPEFRVGDDVVLDHDASNNQKRGSTRQSFNVNFSRSSQNSPGLLRYTIDALRADFSLSDNRSLTQTRRDSSRTINVGVNYSASPTFRPIRLGKSELKYYPENLTFSARLNSDRRFSFSRDLDNPDVRRQVSAIFNKTANLNASGSFNPLRSLRSTYRVDSSRDLTADNAADWLFGFNIGDETRRMQDVSINWNPPLWRLAPNMSFRGNSRDDHSPSLRQASDPAQVRNLAASQNVSGSLILPLTVLTGTGARVASTDTTRSVLDVVQGGLGRIGRFQDIRASGTLSQSRDFSYATGVPRWQYYLGFSTHPGTDVELTSRGRTNQSKSRSGNLSTGIDFTGGLATSTSYAFNRTEREASFSAPLISKTRTWPDIDLSWRQVQSKLPIRRIFRTMNLDSRYSRDRSESGPRGDESQDVTVRSNWKPLFGMNGTLVSGWSSRVQFTTSSTRRDDNNAGLGQFSNTRRRQLTISFTRRYDRRSGFKLPWMKESMKLAGDLALNFDINRSSDFSESGRAGQRATLTRDSSNTQFRTSATYGFKNNVDATFSFNHTRNNDNKTGRQMRSLSLSGSLVFNF